MLVSVELNAEPGHRPPAPGELRRVQAFLNTNDIEGGRDELTDRHQVRRWLVDNWLIEPDAPVRRVDVERLVGFREALRAFLVVRDDPDRAATARAAIDVIAAGSLMAVTFANDGRTRLEARATGVPGAIGRLLAAIHGASIDRTWARLRVCANDECRWVYYDHSHNRSGRWCTMRVCGARQKSRAFRQRAAASSKPRRVLTARKSRQRAPLRS
jgi:predicted RNA-binding Zn ribbon-like protein